MVVRLCITFINQDAGVLQTKVQLMSSAFLPRMRWTLVSRRWKLLGRLMEVSEPPSHGQRLAHQLKH